jgi:ankyrin repeat protein
VAPARDRDRARLRVTQSVTGKLLHDYRYMTSLHAYFYNRDQAAFQRHLSTALLTDVNARDWLGRTVLHLACAVSARPATEYVRLLLAHPGIDVNLQDVESHWTALHRALYDGNIVAAYVVYHHIFGTAVLN